MARAQFQRGCKTSGSFLHPFIKVEPEHVAKPVALFLESRLTLCPCRLMSHPPGNALVNPSCSLPPQAYSQQPRCTPAASPPRDPQGMGKWAGKNKTAGRGFRVGEFMSGAEGSRGAGSCPISSCACLCALASGTRCLRSVCRITQLDLDPFFKKKNKMEERANPEPCSWKNTASPRGSQDQQRGQAAALRGGRGWVLLAHF